MRTFVFAIGGSGARVLRSLTMLLASGCDNTSVANPIIPIIVDYDTSNGDTRRAQELMELYYGLHNEAYRADDTTSDGQPVNNHFFCTPLKMLRDMCDDMDKSLLDAAAKFDLHLDAATQTNITFAQHIGYGSLNVDNGTLTTKLLLDSLYDTSPERLPGSTKDNPKAELHMNLHKGFRGCPNLGCIVTKQLEESPEIQLAVGTLIQPTDKIVIVGSIFGGTGASGIPMLLDLFDRHPQTKAASKAVIAVMPYFALTPDNNSSSDSNTFIAKAKAAISAYEKTVNQQANCIYYVGDDARSAFANHDGEKEQKNDAHYVELVSAMCIMDFITQREAGGFECCLENWQDKGLDITAFYKTETQDKYIHPMSRFKLFSVFCKRYLFAGKNNSNDIWLNGLSDKGCKAIGNSQCNDYRSRIKDFVGRFDEWIEEMAKENTHRPLLLYNNTTEYREIWKHVRLETPGRWYGTNSVVEEKNICQSMTDSYNELNPKAAAGIPDRPEYLFWRGAKYTMDKIDNLLQKNKLIIKI